MSRETRQLIEVWERIDGCTYMTDRYWQDSGERLPIPEAYAMPDVCRWCEERPATVENELTGKLDSCEQCNDARGEHADEMRAKG